MSGTELTLLILNRTLQMLTLWMGNPLNLEKMQTTVQFMMFNMFFWLDLLHNMKNLE